MSPRLNECDDQDQITQRQNAQRQVADLLRELIASSGRTQADVARTAGITPQDLSSIVRGKRNISVRMLADLFYALGYELVIIPADL